jgi:hypothetical protein
LAAFQAELPTVAKASEAKVVGTTKDGRPYAIHYTYADLADVTKAVVPKLARHGLVWICLPTMVNGQFGLVYELLHVGSGESRTGFYPLDLSTNAQANGSAITYARRYTLLAVTAVAPAGDDDDGAQAVREHERRGDDPKAVATLERQIRAAGDDAALRVAWEAVVAAAEQGRITGGTGSRLTGLVRTRRDELAAPPDPVAQARKRVFALFRALGVTDRDTQHRFAAETLQLAEDMSFTSLTPEQWRQLGDVLERRKKAVTDVGGGAP